VRPSHLRPTLLPLVFAHRAAAQAPTAGAPEVVRLIGGSGIVGRVTPTGDGRIHLSVDGLGDIVIDSSAIASRSPVPPPPPRPPSPWSGTVNGSITHISTVVPGVAGSTLGAQITVGIARTSARGALTLDGNMSYWRVDPATAAVNQWGLTLGGRRMLTPRWVLMGRTAYHVNRVQYLEYRSTTIAGLGYFAVKSNTPPSVEGPITGVHDEMTLQLTPTLSFQQDLHYFWSLGRTPARQAQFNARLVGMMTTHFGLSIAFKQQYDTSMPPSVNRTLRSLVSGVQVTI
jgi:hypothetical protein